MKKHGLRSGVGVLVFLGAFFSQLASAAPMSKEEFFHLIRGTYRVSAPENQEAALRNRKVTISMHEGEILFENDLSLNSKSDPALYQVTSFECYNHAVPSTTCGFRLGLKDVGGFIHFLGLTPLVRVDRFDPTLLRLEIDPLISRADVPSNKALAPTILQKI